ncbi:MAG: hypothetical protein HYT71_01150 [Candidatus Aenigmarchaeota archaeon]|nr:hypothetical protein [Candidatus Aenigmarchaeota archaeon]
MVYTIGVSSGWWGIAKTPDLLGLGYKAMSAATYGVNFVQLDIESPSEFMEPLLEQQLTIAREDLGLNYGIHGEFDLKLEHAVKDIYDIYHERLIDHIRGAVRTKSSYMHFHASSEPPPTIGSSMLGYRFQRLVAPNGNTLYDLLTYFTPVKEGNKNVYKVSSNHSEYSHLKPDQIAAIRRIMLENYIAGGGPEATDPRHREFQDMSNDYQAGIAGIAIGEIRENISKMMWRKMKDDLQKKLRAHGPVVKVTRRVRNSEGEIVEALIEENTETFITSEEERINRGSSSIDNYVTTIINNLGMSLVELDEYFKEMRNIVREELHDKSEEFIKDEMKKKYVPFFGYDERLAYEIVGRLMEGSQQWKTICHTNYVRAQLTSQFKAEDPNKKFSDSDITVDNLLRSHDRRVQALVSTVVAMEYIDGHFSRIMQYRDPDKGMFTEEKDKNGKIITVKEYIKNHNFVVTFETPQIEQKQEGLLRIVRSEHIYYLVKKIRQFNGDQNFLKDYVFISLDFEHMLTHNLNIDLELDELPSDGGAFCKVIHVGQPKPIHPAHAPIYVGSEAQELIYRYLFKLRKKGFKDGWIVFERGGGQSPLEWMRSSVYAMRLIVEYLEKEWDPDKLPVEFYGVSPESEFSEQRQMDVIHNHFFAPLAGTLAIPEEEHTFLGRLATERAGLTPEKWKKEELR